MCTMSENTSSTLVLYEPVCVKVLRYGSTATVARLRPGVVLKAPRHKWWDIEKISSESRDLIERIKHSFCVEQRIFETLGDHPRIIKYFNHIWRVTVDSTNDDSRIDT